MKLPKQHAYALGRLKQGTLNKLEQSYSDYLKLRLLSGEILWYKFEGLKFRLADNTFYTPDFAVMLPCGTIELHEVKGHWLDDARVKTKVAADLYPFQFIGVTMVPKKQGGGWAFEHF